MENKIDRLIKSNEWTDEDLYVHFENFVQCIKGQDSIEIAAEAGRIYSMLFLEDQEVEADSEIDIFLYAIASAAEQSVVVRLAKALRVSKFVAEHIVQYSGDEVEVCGVDGLQRVIDKAKKFEEDLAAGLYDD